MGLTVPTNKGANGLPGDDQEFEELEIAEEELIDAYVRNQLSEGERKLLEKGLLNSSRLVERLHFARLLAKEVTSTPQQQPAAADASIDLSDVEADHVPWWRRFFGPAFRPQPAFGFALGVCLILLLLGGGALFAGWVKLRRDSQQLAIERSTLEQQRQALERRSAEQQSATDQHNAELLRAREQQERDRKLIEELERALTQGEQPNSQRPAAVATLFVFPGLTRGGEGHELVVSPGVSKIKLELGLETVDYASYRAVIKTAQGAEILRQAGLKPRSSRAGKLVALEFPARHFPPGDYTVLLSGIAPTGAEPVNDYAFRIASKQK